MAPESENDTKEKNGKTYNWCTKHKMWTIHKSSEFTLGSPKEEKNKKEEDSKDLQLKQALSAIKFFILI